MKLKSDTVLKGRRMAGARSLWRANGMLDEHMGRPVIAIVNSFSETVPGHRVLNEAGRLVKEEITALGCFAPEFNTIAIDDGIAMGHGGMLYSLPSRDLIADSIEYMINAHCIDAMICISNCDKITPGMLMAAMRLNIPALFVSGGPMEAGRIGNRKIDLVDVMVAAGDDNTDNDLLDQLEKNGCPGCGSCSGMFTANSMNCLTEAIGLALPGNGTVVSTHKMRKDLMLKAARQIVAISDDYYTNGESGVLPRSVASRKAFLNAMAVDIAMGGSTNTILHLLAIAHEGGVEFSLRDVDALSRKIPNLCKVSPSSHFRVEDVNRAGGIMGVMAELRRGGYLDLSVNRVDGTTLGEAISRHEITGSETPDMYTSIYYASPGGPGSSFDFGVNNTLYDRLDKNREGGCIRNISHAYSSDGGLAVLYGNLALKGSIVKTAGVDERLLNFTGPARVYESQEEACDAILNGDISPGDVVVIRYEGPRGGPGMQEMLYPTSYLKSARLDDKCALVTDGRFSGGTSGLSVGHVSPEAAAGGIIALVQDGDLVEIDIPLRKLTLLVSEAELARRLESELSKGTRAWKPSSRKRVIAASLQLYSMFVSSADMGAVRILDHQ
jgi:dihydroxy-acid dehydratase